MTYAGKFRGDKCRQEGEASRTAHCPLPCLLSVGFLSVASRHFRNKKKGYLKAKIEELENNSKIKNIRDLYRGINDFKKGYQPRTDIIKDEKGDLVADSHSILVRWSNYFSQLLNVHGVNEIGQAETHTAEPLIPEPSVFEVELTIEKLKKTSSFKHVA